MLKSELKAADAEGKEYIGRLANDLDGVQATALAAEDVFSQLLVKIDVN